MAKVLVIDDDADVLRALSLMLTRGGHQPVLAPNGLVALAALRRDRFAVVICDLFMPVLEGMETIQKIREEDPQVPIIAISGTFLADGDTPLKDARLLGADAAVAKPFTMEQLLHAVEDALDRGHA